MTYETVPVSVLSSEQLPVCGERTMKGNHYESEMDSTQISNVPIPVFEVQYEHVDKRDGQREDKGITQYTGVPTTEMKNDTICSNHSYEIIRDKCDTILEESTEGSFLASQQDQEWRVDVTDKHLQQDRADVRMHEGEGPPKKRPRGSSYENVLSFDVGC